MILCSGVRGGKKEGELEKTENGKHKSQTPSEPQGVGGFCTGANGDSLGFPESAWSAEYSIKHNYSA